jgi:outer membrane protein assembly factor BamD (BamD/ComL family)
MKYLDFDLSIEPSGDGFTARVLGSPSGEATADFSTPFSDLEIENFLLRVGRTRGTVRRIESPEMASAKLFGGRLFNSVFAGDVRGCLRSSIDEASRQGVGLRVRLHLGKAPALADLPWEFLYNASMNRFLGLSVETPVVRFLELPERIRPLAVTPPLRVLMMISSPTDYPQLDVTRESAKMAEALADLEQRGLVTVERQEVATLAELQRRLRQGQYHIFHFIGHGGFDDQAQDGVLILEDAEERGRRVSAQFLGTLLHDHRPLRLAVLNACEGARASRSDPFAGTAQSLVQQGIPAVIAMQFEVTDEAAICFTREFYSAVAGGYPVDAALAEARKAIFAEVSEIEWGTPVLYMRAPDGLIFELQQVSDAERRQLQIASLVTAARSALGSGDAAAAAEKLNQVLALDASHAEASSLLRDVARRKDVAELYDAARAKFAAGQFADAIDALRRLQSLERGYRDAEALLAAAEKAAAEQADLDSRARRLETLRRDANAAASHEAWDEAIDRWQQVLAIAPDDQPSRAQITEARHQQELSRIYERGRSHFELRHWREALAEFHQIQRTHSAYKDVGSLVAQIEGELREQERPAPGPQPSPHSAPQPAVPHVSPPRVASPPQAQKKVILVPPSKKPGGARSFLIGGLAGAAVVVGGILLLVVLAVVAYYQDYDPSRESKLAALQETDATAAPAPAAPLTKQATNPNELIGAPPATANELRQAVLNADTLEIQAYGAVNAQILQGAYTGKAFAHHLEQITGLAAQGLVAEAWMASPPNFGSIAVSRDGQHAVVQVTERWAMNFHPILAPLQCAFHFHERDIPQTAYLQRAGQGWMIYDLVQPDDTPQQVPCHPR